MDLAERRFLRLIGAACAGVGESTDTAGIAGSGGMAGTTESTVIIGAAESAVVGGTSDSSVAANECPPINTSKSRSIARFFDARKRLDAPLV
ncbi:MAG: hypothetical protein PHT15_02665 [Gallionellaceae bacterium]|nr:hypothetical protein [Gallionellaceae bacterium]